MLRGFLLIKFEYLESNIINMDLKGLLTVNSLHSTFPTVHFQTDDILQSNDFSN